MGLDMIVILGRAWSPIRSEPSFSALAEVVRMIGIEKVYGLNLKLDGLPLVSNRPRLQTAAPPQRLFWEVTTLSAFASTASIGRGSFSSFAL
jgi:hypothetical protein